MKKGMRLLALAAVTALLLAGCGTPLYELTDEEENLIVQTSAYMVSKYNIFQKDGMNAVKPKVQEETESPSEEETETTEDAQAASPGSSGGGGEDSVTQGGEVTLAESIGYGDSLEVTYDGLSLMDIYQEESYFSLSANEGKTFVVLSFTLENPGEEDLVIANYGKGYNFYLNYAGVEHIAEKQSIIADSLASYEGTVPAKGSAQAVLIFEVSKDLAEQTGEPELTMEHENTAYSVSL